MLGEGFAALSAIRCFIESRAVLVSCDYPAGVEPDVSLSSRIGLSIVSFRSLVVSQDVVDEIRFRDSCARSGLRSHEATPKSRCSFPGPLRKQQTIHKKAGEVELRQPIPSFSRELKPGGVQGSPRKVSTPSRRVLCYRTASLLQCCPILFPSPCRPTGCPKSPIDKLNIV